MSVCVSVASFETFGSGSFGGPLGGPVGFGGPLGVRWVLVVKSQNGKISKWQNLKMVKSQNGKISKWPNLKICWSPVDIENR